MSESSRIKEAVGLLERIAVAHDRLGDDVQFSVAGQAAQNRGHSPTIMTPKDVSTEMIGRRVASALNKRVGRRREYAVDDIAHFIGASTTSIEKYKTGEAPNNRNLFRLIAFFGPEFASEIFAPLGLAVVEADSVHAAQALSVGGLIEMLPQLRNLAETLETAMRADGGVDE